MYANFCVVLSQVSRKSFSEHIFGVRFMAYSIGPRPQVVKPHNISMSAIDRNVLIDWNVKLIIQALHHEHNRKKIQPVI
jgi:hypothetical protein